MDLVVREMTLSEVELVADYFHRSPREHLDMLGADPTRLPTRAAWIESFGREHASPIERRKRLYVTWISDGEPVGFSSCDKIVFGERAHMHLHIFEAQRRNRGVGTACVRQTVDLYFKWLKLKSLLCEPNAFNVGPNRTLQKTGFRYVKTYMTVPGLLNYRQPVTRWLLERGRVEPDSMVQAGAARFGTQNSQHVGETRP